MRVWGISEWIIADKALILPLKQLCIKETRVGGDRGHPLVPCVPLPPCWQPRLSAGKHKLSFY